MKTLLTAVAIAACAISPAIAQDVPSFGGFKVGVLAGYDNVTLKVEDDSAHKGGFLYGVTAGYDYDLRNAVIGAEVEASDSTVKYSIRDGSDSASLKAGRDLYAGVRVGFKASPSVLVYAKGGYTNARVAASLTFDGDTFRDHANLDGYRIGAGVEYVRAAQFIRLEYRYSDYGRVSADDFDTGISAHRHQLAVTGGFRF